MKSRVPFGAILAVLIILVVGGLAVHDIVDKAWAGDVALRDEPVVLLEDVHGSVISDTLLVPPRRTLVFQVYSPDSGIAELVVEGSLEPSSGRWSEVARVGAVGNTRPTPIDPNPDPVNPLNQFVYVPYPPPNVRVRLVHQSGEFRVVAQAVTQVIGTSYSETVR